MARSWIGVALLFLGLAETSVVHAQYPPGMPMPGGAGATPGSPMPVGLSSVQGLSPAPASMGPPLGISPITLPNEGGLNAFNGESPPVCPPTSWYFDVGGIGLMRQRPTVSHLASLDPGITLANGKTLFADTGNLPPRIAVEALNFHDVRPNYNWGVIGTIGFQCSETTSLELSGYYIFQHTATGTALNRARLDLPFDSFPTPIGFQGNNGLWSQADVVRATLQDKLGSAEANLRYRAAGDAGCGIDFLIGIRYVDLLERFGIFTGDDDLTPASFDIFGNPDPRVQALYLAETHNRILAGQLGLDAHFMYGNCLMFGIWGKGAWGVNFLETDISLIRGDQFVGFSTQRNQTIFSQLYELNAYLEFAFCENIHIRGGYNALWLVDVAEAHKQVDFNLANTFGAQRHNGNIFFHGPTLELHVSF
jgi:hypothetical protein